MNAFIKNIGYICYTVRYCVIHEPKFIIQQVLSTVNGSEQKKSIILLEQNDQYGVHVLTVNHDNYSNISARR